MRPGTFGWADKAPGLVPPGRHAFVVLKRHLNDNLSIGYITHSSDLSSVWVPLPQKVYPSVFPPLSSSTSGIHVTCTNRDQGLRTAMFEPVYPDRFKIHGQTIIATDLRMMDAKQWKILFNSMLVYVPSLAA